MRSEEGLKRSVQYFQEAIDRSPQFARAYAGLADAFNLLGEYGFVPRAEARSSAVAASTRALELDESVAEAHVSLAFIDDDEFRWEAAEQRFTRALALKPGYVTAYHWYGTTWFSRASSTRPSPPEQRPSSSTPCLSAQTASSGRSTSTPRRTMTRLPSSKKPSGWIPSSRER